MKLTRYAFTVLVLCLVSTGSVFAEQIETPVDSAIDQDTLATVAATTETDVAVEETVETVPGTFDFLYQNWFKWTFILLLFWLILSMGDSLKAWARVALIVVAIALCTVEYFSGPLSPVSESLLSGKYGAFLLLAIVGMILLLGRWINLWIRIGVLVTAFVLFGLDYDFFFSLHPSPMCAVTKLFMFDVQSGDYNSVKVAAFLAIFVPSLYIRKLFCGWVCPLGALQELINKIPFKFRWKQFNFAAFNSVRFALLGMFFITFFAVKEQVLKFGVDLGHSPTSGLWLDASVFDYYEEINLFELLHWEINTLWIVMFAILVVSSLMLYRPFCYMICPIGAVSWLLEFIAPGRIRIDHSLCNDCGECVEKSPCPTIAKLIDEETIAPPDCTSCGECLDTCPTDAITFGFKK